MSSMLECIAQSGSSNTLRSSGVPIMSTADHEVSFEGYIVYTGQPPMTYTCSLTSNKLSTWFLATYQIRLDPVLGRPHNISMALLKN